MAAAEIGAYASSIRIPRSQESRLSFALAQAPSARLGVVLAAALGAALVAWLVLSDEGDDSAPRAVPELVSLAELAERAGSLGVPLHWAGPRAGFRYELTVSAEGRVFVRYLPRGVKAGDTRPNFLTVATYPQTDGFGAVQAAAERDGAVSLELPDRGLAVYDSQGPASVYVSYPGAEYQVEVYHPNALEARQLVSSGQVTPADATGSSAQPEPRLTSRQELRNLASFLQLPLHWAGERTDVRYELTHSASGGTFVRYLPQAVDAGDPRATFLTISTYALEDGFGAVQGAAEREGAVMFSLPRGGLAVYNRARPTSVYVSYPGAGYQIEVYHPNPNEARRLVVSGRVKPVI